MTYEATGDTWQWQVCGSGTATILDLADNGVNESTQLGEIATTGDTNSVFTEPSADKLLIDLSKDWPKADTADDLTCTDCINDTEVATNAGTALSADLEEETHASEHSLGGGDAVTATNLASACTDAQVLGGTGAGTGVECQADDDVPESGDFGALTGGAGITVTAGTVATASGETDFLASGALTCTTAQQGRAQVHTTPLQYCDNSATPTLRYAAYGNNAGESTAAATNSVDLTTDTVGSYVSAATASQGLTVSTAEGGTVGLIDCAENEILKNTGTGGTAWTCAADATGGGGVNTFGTMDPSTGADVVADTTTDTLLVTGTAPVTVTGDAAADSLTIALSDVALTTNTSGNYVATITGGAGIASTGATTGEGIAHSLSTASGETDFLASGALTCTTAQQGRMQVHTTPLQYCDNAATPTLRYAAYGNNAGVATSATALAGDPADCGANTFAQSIATSGALTCATPVLGTDTNGNYVNNITASQGLLLTGTEPATVGLIDCAENEILKSTGTGGTSWACAADATGAGGGVATIKEDNSNVTTSATAIDFAEPDATIVSGATGESEVVLSGYARLAGRASTPQTLYGGPDASDTLTLQGSSAADKGTVSIPSVLTQVGGVAPASVAGNGTTPPAGFTSDGVDGGATSGTTGQTAGVGQSVRITSGDGGAAPSGSTNGQGGNIVIDPGLSGQGAGAAASDLSGVPKSNSGGVIQLCSTGKCRIGVGPALSNPDAFFQLAMNGVAPPSVSSGNGLGATQIFSATGGVGGATTDAGGATGGTGGSFIILGGTGGAAPAGSTCGNGGGVLIGGGPRGSTGGCTGGTTGIVDLNYLGGTVRAGWLGAVVLDLNGTAILTEAAIPAGVSGRGVLGFDSSTTPNTFYAKNESSEVKRLRGTSPDIERLGALRFDMGSGNTITTSDEWVFRLEPHAGTVTTIGCEAYAGTSFVIDICTTEDTGDDSCTSSSSFLTGTITCTTSGATGTLSANTTTTANQKVTIVISAVTGTVQKGEIYIDGTVN